MPSPEVPAARPLAVSVVCLCVFRDCKLPEGKDLLPPTNSRAVPGPQPSLRLYGMLTSPNDLLALPLRSACGKVRGGVACPVWVGPPRLLLSPQKEGKDGTLPRMGENKKETFISRGMG